MIMWYVFSEQSCRKTEDLHVCLLQPEHFYWNTHVCISFPVLFDFFVQKQYGLRIISFDENSFNAPTTNNLNRTFLLVHYPFFNILKLVRRKAVRIIYTPGIHTGISISMPICHDIITSISCSKTFWLVSWLYFCFTALRHILSHFERGQLAQGDWMEIIQSPWLAYSHCSWANKNKKWVPLRAMKTFIRKKMGHIT